MAGSPAPLPPAPKTTTLGGRTWLLPFRASGFWVEDARGNSVCDCRAAPIAVALAELLNRDALSPGR